MRALILMLVPAFGAQCAPPQFEVASVKPSTAGNNNGAILFHRGGRFTATAAPLKTLISVAWKVRFSDISGGPGWIDSDTWDITAKADGDPKRDQVELMLQNLLEYRFHVKAHREMKELPVYALVVAKDGAKLKETRDSGCVEFHPDTTPLTAAGNYCGWFTSIPNGLIGLKVDMKHFADGLSVLPPLAGRPVIDNTGFPGSYDIHLEWAPAAADPADGDSGPSIFSALQEQLGLRLEAQKAPVEVFVIDHAEKPKEN